MSDEDPLETMRRLRLLESVHSSLVADAVARLIRAARFHWRDETELTDGLEFLLMSAGVAVDRNVWLTPQDQIDFVLTLVTPTGQRLSPPIGLEVRVKGSTLVLAQRLTAYARTGLFEDLLFVTKGVKHRTLDRTLIPTEQPQAPLQTLVHRVVVR